MKIKSKIAALISVLLIATIIFAGCKKDTDTGLKVRMSVLYDGTATQMKYDSSYTPYRSTADGTNYQNGNLKPAWNELQNRLEFSIVDVTPKQATSVSGAFNYLSASKFKGVNILSGPVSSIVDQATRSQTFIDLTQYKDKLPNFFDFLSQNEIVKKSITSDNGAIYYAPYFDGFDDVETMFLCRVDWVEKLLDSDTVVYDTEKTLANNTNTTYYNGYYDSMDASFEVANADASAKQTVQLSYASGEGIIAKQNALATKDGENLTNTLKAYIKENYIDKGYITKASELYCGQNACYNADELIALWRCVYTNPYLLSGVAKSEPIPDLAPFYPRAVTADRANQVLQLAQIWGVRGYESRSGYLYFDAQGRLQDARVSDDMMEALVLLNQVYNEGLILHDYMENVRTMEHRDYYNNQNLGFMTYDYNQTTSIYNETINDQQSPYRNIRPILYPVADWDNTATAVSGKEGSYSVSGNGLYQYTESWRSVKSEGWCITSSTASDEELLNKCLEIFDYMYTDEGQILMTYGPDSYIEHDESGNMVMMQYKDRQVPVIKEEVLQELKNPSLGAGNYTNYYRRYVGSTLPIGFVKEQGMEYQSVDAKGAIGLDYINNAVKLGTLKHAKVTKDASNVQNSLVPTTFALSESQTTNVNTECLILNDNFNNSSADGFNIFHNYVMYGFNNAAKETLTKEALINKINVEWKLNVYLTTYQSAYAKMYAQA